MSHQEVAQDTVQAGLVRMTAVLSFVFPSVALILELANSGDYRQPAAVIAAWLVVLGTTIWLVPRLRMGGLGVGEAVAAILIATAVVAVTGVIHRAHASPDHVDLAILGTAGLLALVVMSRSPRMWIPGALIIFTVHAVLLVRDRGLNSLSLSQLEAAGYVIAAILIAFAALRPALAMHASMVARQASLASRSAAESAAAAAIQQERQSRLAVLEKEALPLLRGIADGTLDPAAADVRDQCARHAALLRHSFADHASGGELVAALEPALRSARVRGLLVSVQRIGDPAAPRPRVARSVLAALDAVLSALPPHQVTLTVLAVEDGVELYLTFSAPLPSRPDLVPFGLDLPAAACWHAAVSEAETGPGCLEISWRDCDAA